MDEAPDFRQEFLQLALDCGCLRFGDFTLKSGRRSPYFFNAGAFCGGDALLRVGECQARAVLAAGVEFDLLFGPAYKGIPLATACAVGLRRVAGRDAPERGAGHGLRGHVRLEAPGEAPGHREAYPAHRDRIAGCETIRRDGRALDPDAPILPPFAEGPDGGHHAGAEHYPGEQGGLLRRDAPPRGPRIMARAARAGASPRPPGRSPGSVAERARSCG